jgi:carboxyl-terminal processing protease
VQETLDIIDDDYYRTVDDRDLVNRGVGGLVGSLHDQFSQYFDPRSYAAFQKQTDGEFTGAGMSVTRDRRGLRVSQVYRGSPAQRAGIRAGDFIVGVDGASIAGRSSSYSTGLITGKPGTRVTLTVLSGRRRTDKEITRARISLPIVSSRMLRVHGHKLAYVALSQFSSGAHGEVAKALKGLLAKGARGIVFDLRDDGGGLLDEGVLVSSIFIPKGVIVTTKGRRRPRHVYDAEGHALAPRTPLVVLVNRGTASASEIVTGAIQDHHRGKVVGTNTFGKGVFQEIRMLSNGGALKITVGEYFTPNGRNLGGGGVREGKGLTPDVRVAENPRSRRDEQLAVAERALLAELR